MRTTRLLKFSDVFEEPPPREVRNAAGMISSDERRFLYGYTAGHYSGAGLIVDAGIFLGASTIAFGFGLNNNRNRDEIVSRWKRPIKSYERATFRTGMDRSFAKYGLGKFEIGSSFEHILRERIAAVVDLVDLNIADIANVAWGGDPIEILFLDVLKNADIHRAVMRTFFRHLTPGALVVQQDYFIETMPFIKVSQEYLSSYFDFVGEISPDAIFRLANPIPLDIIEQSLHLPLEKQLSLLDAARDRTTDPARKLLVEVSKVFLLHHRDPEQAGALLDSIATGVPQNAHWRVHHAFDRARAALGRPRLRAKGAWRPPLPSKP